jgi:hypothetical protein
MKDDDEVQRLIQAYKSLSPYASNLFRTRLLALSDPLSILSQDLVLFKILPRCSLSTLLSLSLVNKAWSTLINTPALWHGLASRDEFQITNNSATLARDGILTGSIPRSASGGYKQAYISHYTCLKNWSLVYSTRVL